MSLIEMALKDSPNGATLLIGKVTPKEIKEAREKYPGYLIKVEGKEVRIRRP